MSYWRLYYHVVWATKNREPMIDGERERVLRTAIQAKCSECGTRCHASGFMPDHVHLVASIPPRVAVSDFVAEVKGSASHLMNHPPDSSTHGTFAWQREFGVVSFGERSPTVVVAYVENQRRRHADGALYPGLERIDRRDAPSER